MSVRCFYGWWAEDFLDNCFEAGDKEDKKYLSFPTNTELKKKVKIGVDLKRGTKVKC